ncbi:unnamed protein product [Meganyctiphanes norvegica]|uniref:C2H2-type domain-containing protein n=1 Tax=Meganyctiphanes norvegica TaxID=48144 RepID=A0AAV2R8L7_MEGNR
MDECHRKGRNMADTAGEAVANTGCGGDAENVSVATQISIPNAVMGKFQCTSCKKELSSKDALVRHYKRVCGTRSQIPCNLCDKVFKCEAYLKDHVRVKHFASLGKEVSNTASIKRIRAETNIKDKCKKTAIICNEEGCMAISFGTLRSFRKHLLDIHGKENKISTHQFYSLEEFDNWKDATEIRTGVSYKGKTGWRKNGNTNRMTFYCRRSGNYKPRSIRKRKLKLQGTCRIGTYCSSTIEVRLKDGCYDVKFFEEHSGHTLGQEDMKYTNLPMSTKNYVAERLSQNVPKEVILEEVRNFGGRSRSTYITHKDIWNIEEVFDLGKLETPHKNDVISCRMIVESLGNEILFYKEQGQESFYPNISKDDFLLVIMKAGQEEILKKHMANDKLDLCMDATHGISGHKFEATTLMCITDHNDGFPVSICVSNKVDENIIKIFLSEVKKRVGELKARVFISDDAYTFQNVFLGTFGINSIRFMIKCTWHTERPWQKKLKALFKTDSKLKANIYSMIHVLKITADVKTFWIRSGSFEKFLNEKKCFKFLKYFQNHYLTEERASMWAYCYRHGIQLHTNNYLEAMHRALKHVYEKGKKIKRVDKSIVIILELIDGNIYKQLYNQHFGVLATQFINKHEAGVCLTVLKLSEELFNVNSASKENVVYEVENLGTCEFCRDRCPTCKACRHMFSCTCIDAVHHLCKHAHAVMTFMVNNEQIELPQVQPAEFDIEVLMKDIKTKNSLETASVSKIEDIENTMDEIKFLLNSQKISIAHLDTIQKQQKRSKATLERYINARSPLL